MPFLFVGRCLFHSVMLDKRSLCAHFTDERIAAARDFKPIAQGHSAGKRWSQDSILGHRLNLSDFLTFWVDIPTLGFCCWILGHLVIPEFHSFPRTLRQAS